MYARGTITLILVIVIAIVAVGLGTASALGAFSPISPAGLAAIGDFNRIEMAATGEMQIIQGAPTSIAIDAGRRDLRRLRVYRRDKTLFIEHRNDWLDRIAPSGNSIRYVVHVDRLDALTLTGVADVGMDGLAVDTFDLAVNGLGTVSIDDVNVERLKVNLAGGGDVTLTGAAVDQALSISGAGVYSAGDLQSETARIQLSGNSMATLWVTLALDAELSGNAHLSYYGNPIVSKRLSGLSGVEHLGAR